MKKERLKNFFKLLRNRGAERHGATKIVASAIEEMRALQDLQTIISGRYVPRTSSSICARDMRYVLNDIAINERHCLIEFGSGLSTIYIANLIKANGLNAKLISVEDNKDWLESLQERLISQEVADTVEMVYAPLVPQGGAYGDSWYSSDAIRRVIPESACFDCVLIDGPAAYTTETSFRRRGVIAFIDQRMSEKAAIFIDDIDRPGEQNIVEIWKRMSDWRYQKLSNKMGLFVRGKSFNII